ncbi:MAG TPA: permease, partial [Chthoniobacterales bacterium]
ALAFMFASTNLVIEMGIVLWLLMGWPFVLAEFLGAFVLVATVWLLVRLFLPKQVEREMIEHAGGGEAEDHCCHHDHSAHLPNESKLRQLASAFLMDWQMLWKEILGGFLIAGFLSAVVPNDWWKALFLETGSAPLRLIANALVGPLIAIASFVCSVGNIPLAQLLWSQGISFGGVISFIYADLLVVPLILIYAKYYGWRATAYIVLIFYVAMVVSGVVVDLVFSALGIIPTGARPPSAIMHAHLMWNYTSWLDIVAAAVFSAMLYLHLRRTDEPEHQHPAHQ